MAPRFELSHRINITMQKCFWPLSSLAHKVKRRIDKPSRDKYSEIEIATDDYICSLVCQTYIFAANIMPEKRKSKESFFSSTWFPE